MSNKKKEKVMARFPAVTEALQEKTSFACHNIKKEYIPGLLPLDTQNRLN
ncbi:MAG TPA: hypothetical protein VFC44_24885 [Candidatus Saccharimonadales bacterium]|nr:hypothetical protein [Candidatus Saccharimonadales bacterium]